ncbi:tetratricopeptide repeat protein [Glycomyces arizonensis]|uniref:tetratricopeptide repeat protein n=1 Tax=Glycomyces arizonensis TaxID=256035 RepID=UPI00041921F8|nr:tetratricopeptide repeat protein [Glycomyces arizonensis]
MPDDESYLRNEFRDTQIHNLIQAHVINMSPPRPPRPMEVPLPPRPWSDREAILEALRHSLAGEARSPVVVTGPSGAGKSAIAAKLAQQLQDHYPDGQLYIDLEYEDLFSATRSALLRLGQPKDQLADTFGGLLAHYRSATRGRSMLVIVDGADDAAEGLHLVPASATSGLMVFALRSSAGAAGVHHEIGGLGPEDAARLLVAMSEGIALAPATDLVTHYGTRPGTVRRLAGLIRARRRGADAGGDIVRALVEHPDPDLLEATYRTLSPSASWLYRLLSVLPGSEFEESVLAVFATPGGDGSAAFDELVNAQLVTRVRPGWCLIEPSVSRDASRRAERESLPIELLTAMRTTLRWYCKRAQLADRIIMGERLRRAPVPDDVDMPPFDSSTEAMAWFQANHAALATAVTMAALHGWNEEAWATAEAMWAFFINVPYPEEAARCYEVAVAAATRPVDRARMLLFLGRTQLDLGRFAEADGALREARATAAEHGDRELVESAIALLGRARYRQGRYREAIACYEEALSIAEREGRARAAALQLMAIGRSHRELGDPERAESFLERALERFTAIEDGRHVLLVSGELAVLRAARGEPGALQEADRLIGWMRQAGLARHEGESHERLAAALDGEERRRRLEAALEAYERVSSVEARRLRRMLR